MIGLSTIRQMIAEKLDPLRQRLAGMIVRGEITRIVGDSEAAGTGDPGPLKMQRIDVKLRADETDVDIEAITPHGFTSRPAAGAEAITFAVGGNPSHRVAFLFDRRTRLSGDLAEGEAALHIGLTDQLVALRADGSIEIQAAADVGSSVVLKPNGDVVILPGPGGKVYLAQDGAPKHVALAETITARLDALVTAINAWTPVAMDGGAALKIALTTWLGGSNACAADNTYAKG